MAKGEGNRMGKVSLEFDIADIPMIREAMSLGAGTALCYGREGEGSRKGFKAMVEELDRLSPIPGGHRSEAYQWRDACARLRNAACYSVRVVAPEMRHQEKEFRDIQLVVDGRVYRVAHEVRVADVEKTVLRMSEALQQVAGIDTVMRTTVAHEMAVAVSGWDEKDRNDAIVAALDEMVEGVSSDVLTLLGSKSHYRKTEDGRELVTARIEAATHVHERLAEALEAVREASSSPKL